MTTLQATYSGDLTTSITDYLASTLFDSFSKGKKDKDSAQKAAAGYGVDVDFKRGEFTSRAFRDSLIEKTVGKRFVPKTSMYDTLARGQSSSDPLMGTPAHVRNLPEYQQLANEKEKQYKAKNPVVNKPSLEDTATNEKPFKVTDKKLGAFLATAIAAINNNYSSLGDKIDDTQSDIIAAKEGIFGTIKQLEQNTDLLEIKLDAIIDALRDQNYVAKEQIDKSQSNDKIRDLAQENDHSGTERLQDIGQSESEAEQLNFLADLQEIGSGEQKQSGIPDPWDDNIPRAEEGAIVSGPDSGYPTILHGREMVIPIDNNYTQGEPSAVDGKINPVPQTPIVQRNAVGIRPNVDNTKVGNSGPSNFNSMLPSKSDTMTKEDLTKKTKDVRKSQEAAITAPGLITMSLLQQAVSKMGHYAGDVANELRQVSAPIANAFGVSNSITNSLVRQVSTKEDEKTRRQQAKGESGIKSKRAWWDPLGVFTGKGGGSRSSTVFNRSSTNVSATGAGGGPSYGGGGGLPGTGRVMAPRTIGDQTVAGYQNKFLGFNWGNVQYPRDSKGQGTGYSTEEMRRYQEQTGNRYGFVSHGDNSQKLPLLQRLFGNTTGNERLDDAIQNANDIGNVTGTSGLMDKTSDTAIKIQNRYDALRKVMQDAGMPGADKSMNMYGKPMGDQSFNLGDSSHSDVFNTSSSQSNVAMNNVRPPTTRGDRSAFVELGSQEQALSRHSKKSTNLDPIIINSAQEMGGEEVAVSRIDVKGDIGFDRMYPSLYS